MNNNFDSNKFIIKYCPNKSENIICNQKYILLIKKWLNNFENEKNSSIIISGIHGIGKSLSVNILLRESGFKYAKINFDEILHQIDLLKKSVKKNKQLIVNMVVEKYIQNFNDKHLLNHLYNENQKIAFVVDDVFSITTLTYKNIILSIKKYNDKYKKFPLIFITDDQHNKLVSDLKKKTNEYIFEKPTDYELEKIITEICTKEKIRLDLSQKEEPTLIDQICDHSQYDIRRLIHILQALSEIYEHELITKEMFETFIISSKKKDTDINIYMATDMLFEEYCGIDNSITLFESDRSLIPLTIHQNYFKYIQNKMAKIELSEQLTLLEKISDTLSKADLIEGYVHSNQLWDFQEISGYYSAFNTSFYINEYPKNKSKMDCLQPCYKYVFPKDLNRTSIKNINKKNISNIIDYFPKKNIYDFVYLNKIVNNLISQKKFQELFNLLDSYNLNISKLDSLIKIDKINKSKNSLEDKIKKKLLKYFDSKK